MKFAKRKVKRLAEEHHEVMRKLVRERYPNAPEITPPWRLLTPGQRADRITAMEAVLAFAYAESHGSQES